MHQVVQPDGKRGGDTAIKGNIRLQSSRSPQPDDLERFFLWPYFTQGEVDRLRGAGYNGGFTALEDAVALYVKNYLDAADRFR